jgi:mono/diheme cytochrome c family protein
VLAAAVVIATTAIVSAGTVAKNDGSLRDPASAQPGALGRVAKRPAWAQVAAPAQSEALLIWAGIYSSTQAARGRVVYEAYCTRCHGLNLLGGRQGGAGGPALKDANFWLSWERAPLSSLYSKISRTMPLDSPASLRDDDYSDVLAFILSQNAFPAGNSELTPASDLANIRVLRQSGEVSEAPNFAVVQVVGCLAPGPNNSWMLTRSTTPLATRDEQPTADAVKDAQGLQLGTGSFRLLNLTRFNPTERVGRKVEARGLLNRADSADPLIDVLSLTTIGPACSG